MALARKLVLALALVSLLVVAVIFGWRLYQQWPQADSTSQESRHE